MAEKVQFYPLDATYGIVNGKAVISLYGKTLDDKRICILDSSFEPYFYVIPKGGADISEKLEKIRIENNGSISSVSRTEKAIRYLHG